MIKKLHLEEEGYSAKTLAQKITVTGNEETNMIEVKVINTDAALATSIANTLVDEFYAFLFTSNQKQAKEAVAYLASQLKQTEDELKKTTEAYQEGKAQARNSDSLEKELMSKTDILTTSNAQLLQSQVLLEQLIAGKNRLKKTWPTHPPSCKQIPGMMGTERPVISMRTALRILPEKTGRRRMAAVWLPRRSTRYTWN